MTDKPTTDDTPQGVAPTAPEGPGVPTDVLVTKLRQKLEAAEWRALVAETYIEQLHEAAQAATQDS